MRFPRPFHLVALLAVCAFSFASCSKPEADNTPMEEVSFTVKGMTCQGCANTVTTALKMQPGVKRAAVDFDTGTAKVEFSEGKVTPGQLAEAVRKAGYTAEMRKE